MRIEMNEYVVGQNLEYAASLMSKVVAAIQTAKDNCAGESANVIGTLHDELEGWQATIQRFADEPKGIIKGI